MRTPIYTTAAEGRTIGITLIAARNATDFSFADRHVHLEPGNLYLFHQGTDYHIEQPESCLVFLFPMSFFDDLFLSQIADCRLFYDFFMDTSGHSEYLFFQCAEEISIMAAIVQLEQVQNPTGTGRWTQSKRGGSLI